ncbi:uroporphyrinogen decarboxylase [Virgibacillus soli]|uniref:uroporphyrinogen decarboxylase n=1 Tax=Paracerasibacillus soli TaxID=480284 RepID=UPI0035E66D18
MSNVKNNTIIRAYQGEKTNYTPAWYMRQAGRSQKEYLEIRKKYTLFEITHNPEICAYVTRLPVENYGNDAAILYKDIMSPLPAMGIDVEIKSGIGPVIDNPIRTKQDIDQLGELHPEVHIPYVLDTIRLLTKEQLTVPLIGFSGAPFTLASYMIEGGPSKTYSKTKAFMYTNQEAWFSLMEKLGDMVITYTKAQIDAGVAAIQIFDSWVGALHAADYRYFIKPVMNRIFSELRSYGVPLILFGIHARHLLMEWNDLPVDVIGLDWRTSISEARQLGVTKVLQGNLDPTILLADWEMIEERTKAILDEGMADGKHVFNLGHGVTPDVRPATLKRLTELIHTYSQR